MPVSDTEAAAIPSPFVRVTSTGRKFDLELDAMVSRQPFSLFGGAVDHGACVHRNQFQGLFAGIRPSQQHQTVHHLGRSLGFLQDIVQGFQVLASGAVPV